MTLPALELDDLRFQALVDECRRHVAELCPEWSEVNVSDPGITLIELFAWMTDQLSYRINRIPEKLQLALLALLDVHLHPPIAATADLRFRLEGAAREPVHIPAWHTEASTPRAPGRDPVVFQTVEDFTIVPLNLDVYLLEREKGNETLDISVKNGVALPAGDEQRAFGSDAGPQIDDCILLGFLSPLDRLLVRVDVTCAAGRGTNIEPAKPPIVWEASTAEPDWVEVEVLSDTTAGFNEDSGVFELALPGNLRQHLIGGYLRHWLRCRLIDPPGTDAAAGEDRTGRAREGTYNQSPLISRLSVGSVGATLPAQHAQRVDGEVLGRSEGTPGQTFRLQRSPILALAGDERLEVRASNGDSAIWSQVETFAASGEDDRHYELDEAAGEVEFGPVVRQPDGFFRRYGAVPPTGAEIRLTAYRHGGGMIGNVLAGSLTQLRTPIPTVRSVTNPRAASGGVDGEMISSARTRMALEFRTLERAVTAADFEQLARFASRRVARAHCLVDGPGQVRVLVVPHADNPARRLTLAELTPDPELVAALVRQLDEGRLIGVNVIVGPPRYRILSAVVSVVGPPHSDPQALMRRVEDRLYTYLNPLTGGAPAGAGPGWELGRPLRVGELRPIVQAVDGVLEIRRLLVYETEPNNPRIEPVRIDGDLPVGPAELIASGLHRVRVEVTGEGSG
ncbi:MAG: putative baseplate assembly protein [Solirubrobacteraceae bacterium]